MTETFDRAWAITLEQEIGPRKIAVNPDDHGSESVYGIRRADNPDMPWPPTEEQAKERGKGKYWTPYHFDLLPTAIAIFAFDWVYNGGRPIRALQELVGVKVDGSIGPKTAAAVAAMNLPALLIDYKAARLSYLESLASWPQDGAGWTKRVEAVYRACCQIADQGGPA